MEYSVQNALFQWEEGERRLREASELERVDLDRAAASVLEELRRRLGSSFELDELTALYSDGVDWALEIAQRESAGTDSPWVVDAAFDRYAREARNYSGGRL
jgi:hypothetical protein